MREIDVTQITDIVEKLCIQANYELNGDIMAALEEGMELEESETGRRVLCQLAENARIAARERMAICQDTGMAVVFIELGQDVHIRGGSLCEAVNEGVRRGYEKGFLRKSVVSDPFERINTGDNTPAVIHYDIVEGDRIKITVAPKGFGSENMSGVRMLKPSDGIEGVKSYILEMVDRAGPNPCPPIVVGVGVGGTDRRSGDERIRKLEEEMKELINGLGIGPAGMGGRLTAMAVNMEVFPTHIAGLPVAVNISCHVTRHAEAVV